MTNQELQDLRRFIAEELMGWKRVYADEIPMWKFPSGRWDIVDFRPDDPTTGQIWMVVERMDSLHYGMKLMNPVHTMTDNGFRVSWICEFYKGKDRWFASNTNPCLAIMLTARAALTTTSPART
jgi:hypothetical protein